MRRRKVLDLACARPYTAVLSLIRRYQVFCQSMFFAKVTGHYIRSHESSHVAEKFDIEAIETALGVVIVVNEHCMQRWLSSLSDEIAVIVVRFRWEATVLRLFVVCSFSRARSCRM